MVGVNGDCKRLASCRNLLKTHPGGPRGGALPPGPKDKVMAEWQAWLQRRHNTLSLTRLLVTCRHRYHDVLIVTSLSYE